jgi:hypothetical protein
VPLSRELGALRPLGRSLPKDEPEEPEPVSEEPDLELFDEEDELPEAPLLSAPMSDEPDELDFELFDAEEDEPPPEALADSTPSDFLVAESSWPVAFMLLAL